MTTYQDLQVKLKKDPKAWLITGVAGFIGSNLLETLLKLNQTVVGMDDFSSGYRQNLEEVRQAVSLEQWNRFTLHEGDIRVLEDCQKAMHYLAKSQRVVEETRDSVQSEGMDGGVPKFHPVDYVLHQAALGSVPRSIEDPIITNSINISGHLNMLVAARDAKIQRFVFAASSSTYGDHPGLPKVEDQIGKPLSPYAVTKYVNELYADVFARNYGLQSIGLRYFNVFGPRQDPNGSYAAVIPKWISSMIKGEPVFINGDGETSRDFCYVDNVVQANILAATVDVPQAINTIYNIALGERTTLNELYKYLLRKLEQHFQNIKSIEPEYVDFRLGDVAHSMASIKKADKQLGYNPECDVQEGLIRTINWYLNK